MEHYLILSQILLPHFQGINPCYLVSFLQQYAHLGKNEVVESQQIFSSSRISDLICGPLFRGYCFQQQQVSLAKPYAC